MTTLYICEKLSQARDIARILGCRKKADGYFKQKDSVVTWCYGHLLEMAGPQYYCTNLKPWRLEVLPVIPESWIMHVKPEAEKQFTIIKNLLSQAKIVVIATDADREGEVIAREILTYCQYQGKIQRLWLSALDDASIKKALSAIRAGKTTENLYQAGLGRQCADWLIGMNMTMAVSSLYGKQAGGVLSVGRVQTPTLKLVVDREKAIEGFTPKDYVELFAQFTTANNENFMTKWQPPRAACDTEGYYLNQQTVTRIAQKIKGKTGKILKFEDKPQKQSAPLCLSLSQLQKLASNRYGLAAQKTLDIAQSLYEKHKATTYPRTDCGYLPPSQFHEAKTILSNLQKFFPEWQELISACDIYFQSPTWDDKKVTAHHGIIPTLNSKVALHKMTADEKKVYALICRYYLAQFLGDYVYMQRSVTVNCESELFKAANHTPVKPGWKLALTPFEEQDADNKEIPTVIPHLSQAESVTNIEQKIVTKKTQPPARFTEGTLIDAMKNAGRYVSDSKYKKTLKATAGIGTEATRANILEILFKRDYLGKKDRQIYATEKGKQLIKSIPALVCDPVLTALWEQQLDHIATGQLRLTEFMDKQKELLELMLATLPTAASDNASAN